MYYYVVINVAKKKINSVSLKCNNFRINFDKHASMM